MDIPIYIEQQNEGVNLLVCDAFLANILREKPKHLDIIDKFRCIKWLFYKQAKKVKSIIASFEYTIQVKLYDEFKQYGII